jgi:glutamyl-Q tRNA(Asp) synthetase
LLGLATPRYAHVPVAVNERGEKLSKQTHAKPIDVRNVSSAIVRALRFLGHEAPASLEKAHVRELWNWAEENWRLERVPRVRVHPA